MPEFHPELRQAWFIPRCKLDSSVVSLLQRVKRGGTDAPPGMTIENFVVPESESQPPVRLRIYRPSTAEASAPALYWIHGGGYLYGTPEQDDRGSFEYALELNAVVLSVDYRLAPENPFPAAHNDVHSGFRWTVRNGDRLGIDVTRLAIGGASAGGGLAAGLALRVYDETLARCFHGDRAAMN